MSTSTAAVPARIETPRLFVVRLPSNLVTAATTSSFRRPWILQMESRNEDNNDMNMPRLGDVLYFPDCLSGAGEFEAMRFVGSYNDTQQGYPLLRADVEQVVFPHELFPQDRLTAAQLRAMYEPLLQQILQSQSGGLTLADVYGGEDVVEEFWATPTWGHDLSLHGSDNPSLYIPWKQCQVVQPEQQ